MRAEAALILREQFPASSTFLCRDENPYKSQAIRARTSSDKPLTSSAIRPRPSQDTRRLRVMTLPRTSSPSFRTLTRPPRLRQTCLVPRSNVHKRLRYPHNHLRLDLRRRIPRREPFPSTTTCDTIIS